MLTQTTLDKLQEALAKLEQQYKSTYTTPEAIDALMKTIKTFNITINDWNTLIDYINVVGLTLDSLYAVVPELATSITEAQQTAQQNAKQYTDDSVQALKDAVAENYAEKTYVNQGLSNKVNRIVSYQGDYLYGVYNGTDKVYEVQKQAGSNGIVQRTVNGNIVVPLTPDANDCATSKQYVDGSISSAISRVYKPQGTVTVDILNSLTITKEMNGYVYDISGTGTLTKGSVQVTQGDNVIIIWNEDETDWKWDKLSGIVDLSNYATKTYVTEGLNKKVNQSDLELVQTEWTNKLNKVLTTNTPTKFRNYTQEVYNYPYMHSLASDGKYIFGIMSKWAEQGRDIVACSYDLNGNLIATKELNESATLESCCGLTVKNGKLIVFQNGGVEKSVAINEDGTFDANWEVYTGFKFAEINSTTPLQDVVYSASLDRLYVKPRDWTDTVYIYANDANETTNNTLLGTFTLKTINGAKFTRMTVTDNCVFANYTNNGIIYPLIAVYTIDGEYLYTSNISYTPEEASVGIDFPAGETFDIEHSNTQGILYLNDSIYFTSISFSTGYLGHKSAIVKCTLINDSKQLILGETGSTAYPGNKGKANADNIKHLQETKADITYVDNLINTLDNPIPVTYQTLSAMSTSGQLIPGKKYRIIDYVTSFYPNKVFSTANHVFDIIVKAQSNTKISPKAEACFSERDTDGYFANTDFSKWELEYTLENQMDLFNGNCKDPDSINKYSTVTLVSHINGTGTILWMKDEFGNEQGFDFKNLLINITTSNRMGKKVYNPTDSQQTIEAQTYSFSGYDEATQEYFDYSMLNGIAFNEASTCICKNMQGAKNAMLFCYALFNSEGNSEYYPTQLRDVIIKPILKYSNNYSFIYLVKDCYDLEIIDCLQIVLCCCTDGKIISSSNTIIGGTNGSYFSSSFEIKRCSNLFYIGSLRDSFIQDSYDIQLVSNNTYGNLFNSYLTYCSSLWGNGIVVRQCNMETCSNIRLLDNATRCTFRNIRITGNTKLDITPVDDTDYIGSERNLVKL